MEGTKIKKIVEHGKLEIEDIFDIPGRGVVVVGIVSEGYLEVNNDVEVRLVDGRIKHVTIQGLELYMKKTSVVFKGDFAGILLDVNRDLVSNGDVVVAYEQVENA